jgi:hypothetical protein
MGPAEARTYPLASGLKRAVQAKLGMYPLASSLVAALLNGLFEHLMRLGI